MRETGDITTWLNLFLSAVKVQSDDAVWRSRRLIDLREHYLTEAMRSRSQLPQLVEALMNNPFVTVKSFAAQAQMTQQGARNLIRAAVDRGWLMSLGTHGRGGREHWYAPEILVIIEAPMRYDEE